MRVLAVNGSPSGENSITLQSVLYIGKHFPKVKWEILHVGRRIKQYEKDFSECAKALERADLILFCYPVYTFLVPSQLHRFLELIRENGVDLSGKPCTQITTSKHFYDTTAHMFIQENCDDLGMRTIRGLSADMEDLLHAKGQKEALHFFRFVCWSIKNGVYEPVQTIAWPEGWENAAQNKGFFETGAAEDSRSESFSEDSRSERFPEDSRSESFSEDSRCERFPEDGGLFGKGSGRDCLTGKASSGRVVIVTDLPAEDAGPSRLEAMIRRFEAISPFRCELVNIREFPFSGGCLGCFHCAADGTCIYKDGFDDYLRNHIQTSDAIVYAFQIRDHSMGSRFKMFDDRQFCNGHRTVTMGKPVGYLVDGCLSREFNLRTLMEARAQVGGNFLAGTASDEHDPEAEIRNLAETMAFAIRHRMNLPSNFYGVGGMKIFRDLIYQMQGLMKEDHRFYKDHGFYDFPQKKKGTVLGMYLVGAMMTNPAISKKLGGKMTEGMLLPYKKVLEKK